MNMADVEFEALCNLIGADKAEEQTVKGNEFTMIPETLEKVVSGKKVMDLVAEALQEKFAGNPEILQSLFVVKPIFRTKANLLEKGAQLLGLKLGDKTAPYRLAEFVQAIRAPISLKPTK